MIKGLLLILGFISIFMVVCSSIDIFRGRRGSFEKISIYCGIPIIILYIVFVAYPRSEPVGVYKELTCVEDSNGNKQCVYVEFSVEEAFMPHSEQGTIARRPSTIFWPDGGYTLLYPVASEYSDVTGEKVFAPAYYEDEKYYIEIPEIHYKVTEKIIGIGMIDLLLCSASIIMGIVAEIIMNVKSAKTKM